MKRLAVDIVLIPSADLFDQVLAINAELVREHQSDIVLHATRCLPHISLAMGGIDEADVVHVKPLLHTIRKDYPLDEPLRTRGLVYRTNTWGETVSSIELVKDQRLQRCHEKVMETIGPYFKVEVTEDMFVGNGPIAASSLKWVNTFKEKSAGEHFWPHITLGYGKAKAVKIRGTFYAPLLKLCQLGNHCTCRKVLVSV